MADRSSKLRAVDRSDSNMSINSVESFQADTENPVVQRGYLYKNTGMSKKWSKRYFVLEGTNLHSFHRKSDKKPTHSIPLKGATVAAQGARKDDKYWPFVIEIASLNKVFRISSNTENETKMWVSALNSAASIANKQKGSVGNVDNFEDDSDAEGEEPGEIEVEMTFNKPLYPADLKDKIEAAATQLKTYCDAKQGQDGWEKAGNSKGVTSFIKKGTEFPTAKGHGTIPFPNSKVREIIMEKEERLCYDEMYEDGGPIEQLDSQTQIDYAIMKKVAMVAQRDFVNLTHWRVEEDGTILIIAMEHEHPNKPPKSPVVRARCICGGYVLKVNKQNPNHTDVCYVVCTDLGGSVPGFVLKMVTSKQPMIVAAIGKHMTKINAESDASKVTKAVNAGEQYTKKIIKKSAAKAKPKKLRKGEITLDSLLPKNKVLDIPEEDAEFDYTSLASIALIPLAYFMCPGGDVFQTVVMLLAIAFVVRSIVLAAQGPCNMTGRRKLMIASWDPPSSGEVYGVLEIDTTNAKEYINRKREELKTKITITHLVIKAVGIALKSVPSVNGRLLFGNYYPHSTADVGCLVAVEGGKDLANAKICDANSKSVQDIAGELQTKADKLRKGKDEDFEKAKGPLNMLPPFLIKPLVNVAGWLGGVAGCEIPALGVKPYPFGSCLVTSVGMMGLEMCFAPFTPFANVPALVLIGGTKDKAVVVDGEIKIRPMLTLTATFDHRFLDGAQGAQMAQIIKGIMEHPYLLDEATE
eukprot:Nk52_evm32s2039 gene=Nk52_evmTU32s2039